MQTKILDSGYVEFRERWGSDERVIEAARMSVEGGFVSWEPYADHPKGDAGLLKYLYENRHNTPFEMAGMTIVVQAPITVFREWHRHRTFAYNEMSARYTPLPDVNYLPTVDRCLSVSGTNKQAGAIKGSETITHESALQWLEELADVYAHAQRVYQSGLNRGVPKEVARLPVPVGRYSRMMASANLRNWLAFLTLRMDEKAQWEIRQFADAVGGFIAWEFPRTWNLFKLNAKNADGVAIVK